MTRAIVTLQGINLSQHNSGNVIPGGLFYGLRVADGVLRQRIDYTVSGFRRVLFFYINHLDATLRVRNYNFSIRWGINRIRQ